MNRRIFILLGCLFLEINGYFQISNPTRVYFFNNGPFTQIRTLINQVTYIRMPESATTLIGLDVDSLGFLVNGEIHYFHFPKGKTSYYTNATGQFMPIAEDLFWLNDHLQYSRKLVRYEIKNKGLKQIEIKQYHIIINFFEIVA